MPRAAAACPRHNRKPDSAKNTATARSNRPSSLPVAHVVCPVWKATWVSTTPMAAQARIPSRAGTKPRSPPALIPGSLRSCPPALIPGSLRSCPPVPTATAASLPHALECASALT